MSDDVEITVRTKEPRAWLLAARDRARDLRPVWASVRPYMARVTHATFDALGKGGSFRGVTWAGWADQYTRTTDGVTVPAWGGVPRIRFGISTRTLRGGRKRFGVAQQVFLGGAVRAAESRTYAGHLRGGRFEPAREMIRTPTGAIRMMVHRSSLTGAKILKSGKRRGQIDEPFVRGKLRPSGTRVTPDSLLLQDTGALRAGSTENARETPSRLVIFVPRRLVHAGPQQERRPFLFFTPEDADYVAEQAARHIISGGGETFAGERISSPSGSALEFAREQGVRG